jgi:hypothetical protein
MEKRNIAKFIQHTTHNGCEINIYLATTTMQQRPHHTSHTAQNSSCPRQSYPKVVQTLLLPLVDFVPSFLVLPSLLDPWLCLEHPAHAYCYSEALKKKMMMLLRLLLLLLVVVYLSEIVMAWGDCVWLGWTECVRVSVSPQACWL